MSESDLESISYSFRESLNPHVRSSGAEFYPYGFQVH